MVKSNPGIVPELELCFAQITVVKQIFTPRDFLDSVKPLFHGSS